jgi:hypothetical protein
MDMSLIHCLALLTHTMLAELLLCFYATLHSTTNIFNLFFPELYGFNYTVVRNFFGK